MNAIALWVKSVDSKIMASQSSIIWLVFIALLMQVSDVDGINCATGWTQDWPDAFVPKENKTCADGELCATYTYFSKIPEEGEYRNLIHITA